MIELSNETVAIIGFLLGPVARTVYDYLWKAKEEPDIIFDRRYWISMTISIVIGVIAAMAEAALFLNNMPVGSELVIFFSSFCEGFTISHLVNRPVDYLRKKEAK